MPMSMAKKPILMISWRWLLWIQLMTKKRYINRLQHEEFPRQLILQGLQRCTGCQPWNEKANLCQLALTGLIISKQTARRTRQSTKTRKKAHPAVNNWSNLVSQRGAKKQIKIWVLVRSLLKVAWMQWCSQLAHAARGGYSELNWGDALEIEIWPK